MIAEATILAVDDDEMNLEMLELMLADLGCRILRAGNGQEALELLIAGAQIDVILLDLEMPVMDGYETIIRLKQSSSWREIPVIVVTAGSEELTRTLSMGANDFVAKPYNPEELRLRVMNHVRSKKLADMAKEMNSSLEILVGRKTADLKKALKQSKDAEYEISLRLGRAAEYRDAGTGCHIRRISELSRCLGSLAKLPDEQCEILRVAASLHDVGKIGIPDSILLKPGRLEAEEFVIMKEHTSIGGSILAESEQYPVVNAGSIIARQHHEKWDGSGYPAGLQGEEIHIYARIVAIVDVFDALTSARPYKPAFSLDKTAEIMLTEMGGAFDPQLLQLFFEHIDRFVSIKQELGDIPDRQTA